MNYSYEEFKEYIEEEDVKFVRLAFTDVKGNRKNISVTPECLEQAFEYGVAIDASLIDGFGDESFSDLFLHPDKDTTALLPWRPEHGKVVSMFCDITYQDGTPFENDTRTILKNAISACEKEGISFTFGSRMEFYLFKANEDGGSTHIPCDQAGYMDVAPLDKGENVRREIILSLERMGITPINSHHEAGPGQNQINFKVADPLNAADHACLFKTVVKSIAARNGLYAEFGPKPLANLPGSGYHISISASESQEAGGRQILPNVIAGILANIYDTTIFFNPTAESYERLGGDKAPRYISWSSENRASLIRIPAASGAHHIASLRSPDPMINPYLAFAILIYAGLDGVKRNLELEAPANVNFAKVSSEILKKYKTLPLTLGEARAAAQESEFVNKFIAQSVIDSYCK